MPSTTATTPTAAQIDAAINNPAVQRAAEHLAAQQHALLEAVGLRASIAEAVDFAGTADPTVVVATLSRWAAETADAIAAAREAKQQHDAQRLERRMARQPLRLAVSDRLTMLTQEKESLVGRIAAATASGAPRATSSAGQLRYENLLASGLSNEQIAGLGVGLQNPTDLTAQMQQRIAEIDVALVPLLAFTSDPLGDVTPLVGLGFDDLIAARLDG